jgi:hypothetical protein
MVSGFERARVCILFFIIILALPAYPSGNKESPLPVDANSISRMKSKIKELYGWNESEYNLELRAEWDNAKLPCIVAIPTEKKIDWSPKFFVLPDKSIVYPGEPDGLSRILGAVFQKIEKTDARMLAELSIAFGIYGKPVGIVFDEPIQGRIPENVIPRKESEPQLMRSNNSIVVYFYSYDYELLILYDCAFTINGTSYDGKAARLN